MVPHLKWGCVTWAPLSPRPAGSECRDLPNEFLKAPWFGEALNQMTLEPLGTSAVSVELCFFSGPCLMWGNCTPRALSWALGGGGPPFSSGRWPGSNCALWDSFPSLSSDRVGGKLRFMFTSWRTRVELPD